MAIALHTSDCVNIWCSHQMSLPHSDGKDIADFTTYWCCTIRKVLLKCNFRTHVDTFLFPEIGNKYPFKKYIKNIIFRILFYCSPLSYYGIGTHPSDMNCTFTELCFFSLSPILSEVHPRGVSALQEAVPGGRPAVGRRSPTVPQLQRQRRLWVTQAQQLIVLVQRQEGHQPEDVLHQQKLHHAWSGEQVCCRAGAEITEVEGGLVRLCGRWACVSLFCSLDWNVYFC